ncbi:MAG TPA: hypothetical protein VH276_02940 [Solirubrobacteraceae bacterium]|jgi:hypothetical protein|nr:hypothetical protein [Solirubrobacteraceae bacterium]
MLRLILACVVAMLLVTASPAFADTRQQILRECQDGALTGDYTAKEIRDARDNIPTDIDQYSNCRQVLTRALLGLAGGSSSPSGGSNGGGGAGTGGAGGGGSGGGTGGSGAGTGGSGAPSGGLLTPTTPQDQQALAGAAKGAGPVDVGGTPVDAAKVGLGAGRHTLPASVIVALVLLALAAAASAVPLARRIGALHPRGLMTLGRRVVARGR